MVATKKRKKWIMGNWKLNPASCIEATQLASDIIHIIKNKDWYDASVTPVNIAIAPTFLHLQPVKSILENTTTVQLMAQDVSKHKVVTGAYTGDISASLLHDSGVSYVLVGHSERRCYSEENADILSSKLEAALLQKIAVVYCVGESLEQRESGQHFDTIKKQLLSVLSSHTDILTDNNLIIAYEPIWAIGTGKTAQTADIQEMHQFIRTVLAEIHSDLLDVSILYGGSVKPENAADIAQCEDVNGALVGGASLNAEHFLDIVRAFR